MGDRTAKASSAPEDPPDTLNDDGVTRSDAPLTEPTRDEIIKLWDQAMLETADGLDAMQYYTRAILSRYGRAG